MSLELNLLHVLVAVADEGNFRAAADRLGVTRSAVSQAIRRLEDTCEVALVYRTTRSVSLTEAGAELVERVAGPLAEIQGALEDTTAAQAGPVGVLRVAATSIAERFLSGPLVAAFAEAYPKVTLDITVTDDEFDIVAAGFDAGVRLGHVIEQDMVAVPLTGEQREVVVASPDYVARFGAPSHPRELPAHRCIGWRPSPRAAPYRWEFEEDGRAFDVAVEPQITTNDLRLMIRAAMAGAGITFATEETFLPYIRRGELVTMLEEYLPTFSGFFLYFPSRKNTSAKLRALVEHVKHYRSTSM
ncbi:MAG: LysR family transcriptional regulator [Proteobacteria bacterium]|nr:LysR family transcriptional regulator [Pseudomonadota bacterium]